ncbi:hypothetical protein BGZ76_011071 [Entomortierella beljakovae]|nr:hypothetical protein BGZ76_011071 [Entomortierella beljakovae]
MPGNQDTSVTFHGWATSGKHDLKPFSYHPRPLGSGDIEIEISHAGVCATDLHVKSGLFPMVAPQCILGHEIVGKVTKAGSDSGHKVGDIVGVGCMVHCCGTCRECIHSDDQYCSKGVGTYNGVYEDGESSNGGYADKVRVCGDFAFKIPSNISPLEAPPLFCAGVTTYTPLRNSKAGPGKKVGVVGIGGLGHMGIQWARAMGCDEVVAISTSDSKKDEAKKLGATKFINSKKPEEMKEAAGSLDIVLCTTTTIGDTEELVAMLSLVAKKGTFYGLSIPDVEFIKVPALQLIMTGINVTSSIIGSKADIKEMLELASKTNVRPWVEKFSLKDPTAAVKHLEEGRPRYRIVMEA